MRAILFSYLTSLFLHCCFGLLKLLLRIWYNENTFSDAEFYFEFPVDKPDDRLFTADIANRFIIFRRIERKSYLVREIFRRFVIIDDHNPVVTIFCGNVFTVKGFLWRSKRNGISRQKNLSRCRIGIARPILYVSIIHAKTCGFNIPRRSFYTLH